MLTDVVRSPTSPSKPAPADLSPAVGGRLNPSLADGSRQQARAPASAVRLAAPSDWAPAPTTVALGGRRQPPGAALHAAAASDAPAMMRAGPAWHGAPAAMATSSSAGLSVPNPLAATAMDGAQPTASAEPHTLTSAATAASAAPQHGVHMAAMDPPQGMQPLQPQMAAEGSGQLGETEAGAKAAAGAEDPTGGMQPGQPQPVVGPAAPGSGQLQLQLAEARAEAARARADAHRLEMAVGSLQARSHMKLLLRMLWGH